MKRFIWISLLLAMVFLPLMADDVKTIDLDKLAGRGVKAGLELGAPFPGLTVGYRINKTVEGNVLVGSVWNFDRIALGGNLMFTMFHLDIQNEQFPVSIGPAFYSVLGNDGVGLSAGGLARMEYDFQEIPLNLYFHTGIIVNFVKYKGDDLFNFPFAIGIRYIF